jgi:hypothetical protein
LRDNDINDDGDLVFRRVQSDDGRTRVFINDQPASVALMREAGISCWLRSMVSMMTGRWWIRTPTAHLLDACSAA